MRDLSIIFGALADTTRLDMLALLLRTDELCVCDFVETLGISQSKASRHLRYLWNARLLEDRRSGLWVYYRISRSLDADRQTIIKALGRILKARDLSDLDGKLASWFHRKDHASACAIAPARAKPSRSPARNHNPRNAAEVRR